MLFLWVPTFNGSDEWRTFHRLRFDQMIVEKGLDLLHAGQDRRVSVPANQKHSQSILDSFPLGCGSTSKFKLSPSAISSLFCVILKIGPVFGGREDDRVPFFSHGLHSLFEAEFFAGCPADHIKPKRFQYEPR